MKASQAQSNVLEKHKRYKKAYGKNELYWGLGIECESYFEMEIPKQVTADFLAKNHKRERYSVDYYASYKEDLLQRAFSSFENKTEPVQLAILLNSHILSKTDIQLQHKTLYEKNSPPNPKFSGKTIFDQLKEDDPTFFERECEESFTFDGDSIEIMTQNFYRATVDDAITELTEKQSAWIEKLRTFFSKYNLLETYGRISWIQGNHGFAVMATNMNQLAIFNNGTYHINITLPTMLNENSEIKDRDAFIEYHRSYIRFIQWMEPLLIANFGSPDPLAWIDPAHFSAGSQRIAMSRYISVGTFDTETMPEGKILTMDLSGVASNWYTEYHKTSGYNPLHKIGLDINFQKHWNHGVELRFFDWFPPTRLQGLLRFLVYLGDIALERDCPINPIKHPLWNSFMVRVISKGSAAGFTLEEAKYFEEIFGIYVSPSSNLQAVFADFFGKLSTNYKKEGPCSKYFLDHSTHTVRAPSAPPTKTIVLSREKPCKKLSRCF
jgi:hypothetical protein